MPSVVLAAIGRQDRRDRLAEVARRGQGSVAEALRLLGDDARSLDTAIQAVLTRLPDVDWRAVHRLADAVGMSDERFDLAVETLFDAIVMRVRRGASDGQSAAQLVPMAMAWERIRSASREASVLNLDKRPVLLTILAELAEATPKGLTAA